MKADNIVLPGDVICDAKEYKPGSGTYVENGKIKSQVIGRVHFDRKRRIVSVTPVKDPKVLHDNDIILGEVVSVSNTIVNIKVYFVYNKNREIKRLDAPYSATLHISQLGFRAMRMSDYFKVGDLVAAKIILDRVIPLSLTVSNRDLGVVAAYCGTCGGKMIIKDARSNTLVCTKCGKVEKRKLSSMYNFDLFTRYFHTHKPKHFESYNA